MWRFGFVLWSAWQVLRWAVVCALVLLVVYLVDGVGGWFLAALLGMVVALAGVVAMLRGLYRRELTERR
ncbi:hypothetical protein GCM10022243_23830 [Saccharothrix violaceirubra]|uniref:O-antigen/teichoic acid export membrane protein n=1 Tax=Saccharothrix violaceirubra TaxID=413306 RepID=A0A7W7T765_9PSEU|nr:hypothetical protein [Saccharothrix violaceirubra]MBB4967828.1 O-antigen/teichoic acid export membrane protein [Saccharothrix violaceirubra]